MSWSANPVTPTRKIGGGWSTDPVTPQRTRRGGYFAKIEKHGDLVGIGDLSASVRPRYPDTDRDMSGSGQLSATLNARTFRSCPLTGRGSLVGEVFRIQAVSAFLTGTGQFGASSINDGLSAIIQVGYGVQLSGNGNLTVVLQVIGGHQYPDGLSALAWAQYLKLANLVGAGAFSAILWELYSPAAPAGGVGTVTALVSQKYTVPTIFGGGGALSATATAAAFNNWDSAIWDSFTWAPTDEETEITAPLAGTGTLSATAEPVVAPSGIFDDFNRANNDVSLGSDWTNRLDVLGIVGNAASLTALSGGGWNIASHNTPLESDDMEASVILGGSNSGVMLGLGFSEAGEGAFVYNAGDGNYFLYQQTDWGSWSNISLDSGTAATAGDKLTIRRVGNVYSILLNDVQQGTWIDGADSIPRGSDHRLCQIGIYNTGTYDSFEAVSL